MDREGGLGTREAWVHVQPLSAQLLTSRLRCWSLMRLSPRES